MGGGPGSFGHFDWQGPEKRLRGSGYVNKILQQICENEGIPKKGLKAELQQRIVDSKYNVVWWGKGCWSLAQHSAFQTLSNSLNSLGLQPHNVLRRCATTKGEVVFY